MEFSILKNEPLKGPLVFNSKERDIKIFICKADDEYLTESCYNWDDQLFENDFDISSIQVKKKKLAALMEVLKPVKVQIDNLYIRLNNT